MVSRRLTKLLRHDAQKVKLPLRADGFALLTDVVRCGKFNTLDEETVMRIVQEDKKSRYAAERDEHNRLWIRCNQGHSVKEVDSSLLLTKIDSAAKYEYCIHGTTLQAWESGIRTMGLCRMKRNEIHFAQNEFGKAKSGFRSSSQVLIYCNLDLCLQDGIPFFESANGVLLSPGLGEQGIIPTRYFTTVLLVETGEELKFERI